MYVNKQQEYAHNSAKLAITGFLPFFANYGYKLRLRGPTDNPLSVLEEARVKAERIS
jgi:hypothetical protein